MRLCRKRPLQAPRVEAAIRAQEPPGQEGPSRAAASHTREGHGTGITDGDAEARGQGLVLSLPANERRTGGPKPGPAPKSQPPCPAPSAAAPHAFAAGDSQLRTLPSARLHSAPALGPLQAGHRGRGRSARRRLPLEEELGVSDQPPKPLLPTLLLPSALPGGGAAGRRAVRCAAYDAFPGHAPCRFCLTTARGQPGVVITPAFQKGTLRPRAGAQVCLMSPSHAPSPAPGVPLTRRAGGVRAASPSF